MHLELQWSQWMPLACWALHRTVQRGRVRDGVLTAVFVLAQFLSCIYYGVFLVITLALVGAAAAAGPRARDARGHRPRPARRRRRLRGRRCWCMRRRTGPTSRRSAVVRPTTSSAGARRRAASSLPLPTTGCTAGPRTTAGPKGASGRASSRCCCARSGSGARACAAATWMYGAMLVLSVAVRAGLAHAGVPPRDGRRAAAAGPASAGAIRHDGRPGACRCWPASAPHGCSAAMPRGWRRHAVGAAMLAAAGRASTRPTWGRCTPWVQRVPIYAAWLRMQPPGVVVDLPIARANSLPLFEAEWASTGARTSTRWPTATAATSRGATSTCWAR